jgi:glucokinase
LNKYILALDFGGTKHAAGLAVVGAPRWLVQRRVLAEPDSTGAKDRATMLALADALLAETPGELVGIGVSFGGPVDWKRGRVILSHHVPGWEDVSLCDLLQQRYNVPVTMDNDANVAALGEWRFGAGQGCKSLLYITVSTGIGGGWVFDGNIFRGADSMAGEIGHLAIDPNGPECVCGKHGCVEIIGSGTAIGLDMSRRRQPEEWTARAVNEAAQAGDPVATEVMERAAWALGTGIGYAITLMNPEQIVIGGGVANAGELYWRKLRETAARFVLPQMRVPIVRAGLGDESPLWGAVALAQQNLAIDPRL